MTEYEIGDEGAKAISEMIRVNTTMASLNLSCEEKRKKGKRKKKCKEG